MQHVALAQRSANVRGFRDVGKTLAQLVSAGWVGGLGSALTPPVGPGGARPPNGIW